MGCALLVWLEKDLIAANLPDVFKGPYRKTWCTIDCSEVLIERPKSPSDHAATWSDCKKWNAITFLIGIAPFGYIAFLSDSNWGRTTDRYICQKVGYTRYFPIEVSLWLIVGSR